MNKDYTEDRYYMYCTECSTNVLVSDDEPDCPVCDDPSFGLSCTQELDFSDELFDRWE